MQIICISRGTLSGGKGLAEKLAEKLGYQCLGREDLIEEAIKEGIQVGKLETAMLKPGLFSERLALEREYYMAFSTAYLCERAKEKSLVYHGRTGHLLLPGISHVLRVRAVADLEFRIKAAMQQLKLDDRNKARRYIEEVQEDRRRWVHNLYGVSLEDAVQYDIVINLSQLNVENAASAMITMAQLPDFQMTPASQRAMEDLFLGAKARLLLARDERTCKTSFKVRADNGILTITYNPLDVQSVKHLSQVLEKLEGIKEIRPTMATTNMLWIQEKFSPSSETFKQIVDIATKWNAAVELIRLDPGNGAETKEKAIDGTDKIETALENDTSPFQEYNGGIEDESTEPALDNNHGMAETLDELAKLNRSGGGRLICGGQDRLLSSLDRTVPYTLVLVGDVFLSKGHAARARLTREFRGFLADHIHAPVVTADELKSQYLFNKKDAIVALGFLGITVILYYLVFTHQSPILAFLSGEGWKAKALASAAVFLFAPLVAYLYGNVAKACLKLIRME